MERANARIGMKIYFGRKNGEQTLGEIVKINRKNFKVKILEIRGSFQQYPVGSVWNVSPTLCEPANS